MTLRSLSLAVLASFVLTGCGAVDTIVNKKEPPPCPPVYILGDAGQVTKYRDGKGRDLTDVEAEVEVLGYNGACVYDEKGAEVEIQVRLGAKRGPADTDRKVSVEYFIAIPLYFPNPEAKAVFPVTIQFPEGANTVKYDDEPVVMRVPVKDGDTIQKYEIYIGIQTTPEELNRNRQAR